MVVNGVNMTETEIEIQERIQKRKILEDLWDKRAREGILRYDERQEMHKLSIELGDIPKDVSIDEFCYNLKLFGKVYGDFN